MNKLFIMYSLQCIYYYIKDYQGNVRAVIAQDGTLEEINNYYPYGSLMGASTPGVQPFKYGAKELDRQNGINIYDSQARFYDPIICRTTTQDPLAEKYYSTSPYLWCAGNPMKYVDRDGRDYDVYFDNENMTVTISAKYIAFKEDTESLQKALLYWNNCSDKFSIDGYNVIFNLDACIIDGVSKSSIPKMNTANLNIALSKEQYSDTNNQKTNINTYIITDNETKGSGSAAKNYIRVDKSNEFGTTGAHEIGHTLGLSHKTTGIMTSIGNDNCREYPINKKYIYEIIHNVFNPNNSGVGIGTLKSAPINDLKYKIKKL